MLGTFPASLYVGMTTRARSGMAGAPRYDRGPRDDREEGERAERDLLSRFVIPRAERELDRVGTRRDRDRDQGEVAPQRPGRPVVHTRLPVRIPVLGDQYVAWHRRRRVERDGHVSRLPRRD